jgi:hypothetical protein
VAAVSTASSSSFGNPLLPQQWMTPLSTVAATAAYIISLQA